MAPKPTPKKAGEIGNSGGIVGKKETSVAVGKGRRSEVRVGKVVMSKEPDCKQMKLAVEQDGGGTMKGEGE